jgi:predicted nucleotidyltransferase
MVTRMTRDEVVAAIQGCADELRERFGVRSLRLFGSVARNEAAEGSDVDVLVEFEGPRTFRGYMELRIFLEDLLGTDVDLITESGLKQRARPSVERDAIRVA